MSAPIHAQEDLNSRLDRLVGSGEYATALTEIEAARELAGADLSGLDLLKGAMLVRMGKLDQAMAVFEQLAAAHPNDAAIFNNIGVIHASQGKIKQAKDSFKRALDISPEYQQALYNLGDVYAELACRTYGRIRKETAGGVPAYCEPVDREQRGKPVEASVPKEELVKADGRRDQVLAAISAWRSAWSDQDVAGYLVHYSPEFKPDGMSRAKWSKKRRKSLTRPQWIKIELSNPVVQFVGDQARVQLNQRYLSNSYEDSVVKHLVLIQDDGEWRILRERSL